MRALRRVVREGDYDIVHSHHDVLSAVYLVAIAGLPVQRRIVHIHNADMSIPTSSHAKARMLRDPMRRLCLLLSDRIVGISKYTLSHFLGGIAPHTTRDVVLYYGVDTRPFRDSQVDRSAWREKQNLPSNARLLLFAGRLTTYKNPLFVVDVLARLLSSDPPIFAVFAGTGPLDDAIRSRANHLGVADRIRLLGWCEDTAALMRAADVFVFPRLEQETADVGLEGLGLVVVEAQAAGLPMLLSRGIPEDAVVNPQLCEILSLSLGASEWARLVLEILERPPVNRSAAVEIVNESYFSLRAGFRSLMALHAT